MPQKHWFPVPMAVLFLVIASAVPAAAPHPCTLVDDDAERLACYDRAFGTPAAPKPLPDPPPSRERDTMPQTFSAVVTQVEWRNGVFVLTLDNGQVWMQSERNSRVQIEPRESVSIRKASLGSFLLSTRQGIATRVRRVR